MQKNDKGFGTLSVHAGEPRRKAHGAITTPISCTATYVFDDTAEMRDHFEGRIDREEYGRYGNPTVRIAERKLAAVCGSEDCVIFSSGMAAITSTLLAMLRSGQHVILTSDCYRRTRQFVTQVLGRFGVESTIVAPDDYEGLAAAIRPHETRLIISESPTNPYLRCLDLERVSEIKNQHPGVKLIIDATFATPVNQRPLEQGADLVFHSCTKYLGGHNDMLGGAVVGSAPLVQALREFRGVLGGILDAHSGYLLIRGLKTLQLRVARQNQTAMAVARALEAHPHVERVYYPGLESHPDHEIAKRHMRGFGGVVSFLVKGDLDSTSRFIDACTLPVIGPSLGGVESLIEQPALMSFYELSTEQRLAIGIRDNLVRLSVGVEETEDLIADLTQALDAT
ncbi:trans-sulfuration enzyme family protein [Haliangium ochraceum]|uniref:Cystathionine gamma-synthase n=1 Tax=Haliangium ochraceum (strain DSM 14365 / JCM 11303 / SMP-2) TaxID=502025 RepID=D0LV72_HALO1|nr:aminotransferase class I/II-fold pyridoxal phosphate-dependent enzyme [Haliangium ochraceum]ACY15913.1 Cystathionine gamma-synthase [Haliangium ochraceum DSM 14365]